MRYVIGVTFTKKSDGSKYDGYYAKGEYGFSFVLTNYSYKENQENIIIPVFNNINDAITYSQMLSRAFRQDDSWIKKGRSQMIRRFYPVKLDSSKFPYTVKLIDNQPKTHHLYRNRFNEESSEKISYQNYYVEKLKK